MYSSGCGILYGEDRGKLRHDGSVSCLCVRHGGVCFGVEMWRVNNYYAFGMLQPDRIYNENTYNFGYQGSLMDNEIEGNTGSMYSTYFRLLDVRLVQWKTPDPKGNLTPWDSPYVSMANNPIVFNDQLGDKIKGTREEKRAFRQKSKAEGTWRGKNGYKRMYRGNKRHLILNDNIDNNNSIITATISNVPKGGTQDISPRVDYLDYNSAFDEITNNRATYEIDRMPFIKPSPIPIPNTNNPLLTPFPTPTFTPPAPINFNINVPFKGGTSTFVNEPMGQFELQKIADTYLNTPNATQILITIGTTAHNIHQKSTAPDQRTIEELMWDRGLRMRNTLINDYGIPPSAFPGSSWLYFAPGTKIGTIIQIK
jgi:hypothetical protein